MRYQLGTDLVDRLRRRLFDRLLDISRASEKPCSCFCSSPAPWYPEARLYDV